MAIPKREVGETVQPPRVAMLIPRYHPVFGGAETQCRALVQELRALGIARVPFVITRRLVATTRSGELVDGVPVYRVGGIGVSRRREYAFYLLAFIELVRRRREFDMVHCHATSNIGFVATLAGRVLRRPVLLKLSSNGEFLSGLGNYSGRVTMEGGLRGRLRRPMARFMGARATIVALNEEGRRELALLRSPNVHVLPNGVDTERFSPGPPAEREALRRQLGVNAGDVLFLYTGRFVAVKGLDVIINAFSALWRDGPVRPRLCLVGSGDLQYESVANLIDEARRDPRSLLHVRPPTTDVVPYLRAADAFVFASRREGMPNAVLEAIAMGLPCVLSDIAPHREIAALNPAARIVLVPVGDAEALRRALLAVIGMIASGDSFSVLDEGLRMSSVAARYAQIYRSMLGLEAGEVTT